MNSARALALAGLCFCLGAAVLPVKDIAMAQPPRHSAPIPLPRDPDAAVREEFEAARRTGTREAFDLFIARHPQHPLATAAREAKDKLPAR